MQLRLPWSREPAPPERPRERPTATARVWTARVGEADEPVTIARHVRARRYVLRLAADGGLRLTVPRGASIRGGLAFVARQADWIAAERRRRAGHAAWSLDAPIWWRGERLVPTLEPDGSVRLRDDRCPSPRLGDNPDPQPRPVVGPRAAFEAWARTLADAELSARCRALADACGEAIAGVRVRSQRSRWGSCSPRRVISLNWRLIQMPASVSDYVILHELMHLRQPNHSRRFWREVDRACAGWREAERWLRTHGRELM